MTVLEGMGRLKTMLPSGFWRREVNSVAERASEVRTCQLGSHRARKVAHRASRFQHRNMNSFSASIIRYSRLLKRKGSAKGPEQARKG